MRLTERRKRLTVLLLSLCLLASLVPAGARPVHADVHSVYTNVYVQDMEGNVYEEDGGYVKVSSQEEAGDEVSFLAVPREGYRVLSVVLEDSVNGQTDVTYRSSFTMPESDAWITAVFRLRDDAAAHAVSVNGGGAEYILDAGQENTIWQAEPGEKIYAGVAPENAPDGMYCAGVEGGGVTVNEDGSFIMPDADVYLEPSWAWQTPVSVDTENGYSEPGGMEEDLQESLALAARQGRISLTDLESGQSLDAWQAADRMLFSDADLAADLDMDGQADVLLDEYTDTDTCSISEPEYVLEIQGAPCSPVTFRFAQTDAGEGEAEDAGDGQPEDTGSENGQPEDAGSENGQPEDGWQAVDGTDGSGQDTWEEYGGQDVWQEDPSYSGQEQPEPSPTAETPRTITVETDGYDDAYNGQPHFLTVTPTDPASGAVVRYGTSEEDCWMESSPLNTEAGTYTIYYQVTADGYETLTGSEDIVIHPAEGLTVEAKGWSGAYDGQPHTAGAETNIVDRTTITYSTDDGASWSEQAPSLTEQGTLSFRVRAQNPNYVTAEAEGTITITEPQKKTIQVTTDGYNGPYNGQPHFLTVTPTDPASGAVVRYGTSEEDCMMESSPLNTEAGTYTIYYQVTADGYETLTGSEDIVISPAEGLTVEAKGWSGAYDGQPHTAGAETNIVDRTTITYSTDDGASWSEQAPSLTEQGTLSFRVRAQNPNYVTAEAEGTITITEPQKKTIQVTTDGYNGPYNGQPHFLTVTPTDPASGAVVRYGTSGEDCTQESSPRNTDAGTYTIYYQVTAEGYETLTGSEDIVITPAGGLTVTAQNYTGTYDGQTHTAGAAANMPEGTVITYSTDGGTTWSETAPSRKAAGTVSFKVRAENKNYVTAQADGRIAIDKASLQIETGSASKVYDGTALTSSEIRVNGKMPVNGTAVLVNGETVSVKTTGTQTGIGTSSNTCAINWGSTDRNNYQPSLKMGQLTVTGKGVYTCTYGNGSVKRKGTDSTLEFIFKRTQNDETAYGHFEGLQVDGNTPDPANYTLRSGSVVISLQAPYLNSLPAGSHTLTAMFDDGDPVTVNFSIQESAAVITPTGAATVTPTPAQTLTPTPISARPASTGDNSHILLWAALLAIAALGLAGAAAAKKKLDGLK